MKRYKITWFHFDPDDDEKTLSAYRNSFQEMLWLIPHGPFGKEFPDED